MVANNPHAPPSGIRVSAFNLIIMWLVHLILKANYSTQRMLLLTPLTYFSPVQRLVKKLVFELVRSKSQDIWKLQLYVLYSPSVIFIRIFKGEDLSVTTITAQSPPVFCLLFFAFCVCVWVGWKVIFVHYWLIQDLFDFFLLGGVKIFPKLPMMLTILLKTEP